MSEGQPVSMPAPIAPSDVISATYAPFLSNLPDHRPPGSESKNVTKLGKRKRSVKGAREPDPAPSVASRVPLSEPYRSDDKKRNKLGYHRTSVACAHCRRRKIRCIATNGEDGPCQTCVRLKKECHFYPIDQSTKPVKPPAKRMRTEARSEAPSSSMDVPSSAHQHMDFSPLNLVPSSHKESDFMYSPDLASPHYVIPGSRQSRTSISQHLPTYYDQSTSSWDSGVYSATAPHPNPHLRYLSFGDWDQTLSPTSMQQHAQQSHAFKGGGTASPSYSGDGHPSPAYNGGTSLGSPGIFHFQAPDTGWHHNSRSMSLGAMEDPYHQFTHQPIHHPRDALRRSHTVADAPVFTQHLPHSSTAFETVSTPATEPVSLPSTSGALSYSTPQLPQSHQTHWGSYNVSEERYEKEGAWGDSTGYMPGWP